ncbi:hypothetical protein LWI28_018589 [Acer negundo]|uniref:Uncharacterized protein n=1 Tax=Acer negundo TaxID=4023 RepID=A0AAD5JPR1_ACENE|nr:hypothetical protein LWI28_018589 [Acer negundo]
MAQITRRMNYFKSLALHEIAKSCNGKLLDIDTSDNNCGICVGPLLNLKARPLYGGVIRTLDPYVLLRKYELKAFEFSCLVKFLVKRLNAYSIVFGYPKDKRYCHNPENGNFVKATIIQLDGSSLFYGMSFTLVYERNSYDLAMDYIMKVL